MLWFSLKLVRQTSVGFDCTAIATQLNTIDKDRGERGREKERGREGGREGEGR